MGGLSSIPGLGRSPGKSMDYSLPGSSIHGILQARVLEHALEKEMATRSSVLAWRIPGTGEPGGLLSMGFLGFPFHWCSSKNTAGEERATRSRGGGASSFIPCNGGTESRLSNGAQAQKLLAVN